MPTPWQRPLRALVLAAMALTATTLWAQEANSWDTVNNYSHEQKKEAIAAGQKLLAETDKKIAALKKANQNASAETKAAHRKNMAELRAKRKAAAAELAKMKRSAAGAWDATKEGASKAWKDLQQAYDKAVASGKG